MAFLGFLLHASCPRRSLHSGQGNLNDFLPCTQFLIIFLSSKVILVQSQDMALCLRRPMSPKTQLDTYADTWRSFPPCNPVLSGHRQSRVFELPWPLSPAVSSQPSKTTGPLILPPHPAVWEAPPGSRPAPVGLTWLVSPFSVLCCMSLDVWK